MSSPTSDQVIELSVEETNRLRAQLGMRLLRCRDGSPPASLAPGTRQQARAISVVDATIVSNHEPILELSVQETDELRAKLGLRLLRRTGQPGNSNNDDSVAIIGNGMSGSNNSTNHSKFVHAPAQNVGLIQQANDRITRTNLYREVEQGARLLFPSKDDDNTAAASTAAIDVQSWAAQMRIKNDIHNNQDSSSQQPDKQKRSHYDEKDLHGLHVAHALTELEEGTTTVLTLVDAPVVNNNNDEEEEDHAALLENVNLTEQQKQQSGLRVKRQMEMGMGRAGGYAGWDDDEFEELGGTAGPAHMGRDEQSRRIQQQQTMQQLEGDYKLRRGFQIGTMLEEQDEMIQRQSDLFAMQQGKAISLESSSSSYHQGGALLATTSDFMTAEEEAAEREQQKKKKRDKDGNESHFKSKNKKKKEKKKRSSRRNLDSEEDEEEENPSVAKVMSEKAVGLLEELEATAVDDKQAARKRKRLEGVTDDNQSPFSMASNPMNTTTVGNPSQQDEMQDRRAKFDAIMAKGNERTKIAFGTAKGPFALVVGRGNEPKHGAPKVDDEEPDDAFLNAAVAKARRLNKLRAMAQQGQKATGADVVVRLVQQAATQPPDVVRSNGKTITFSVDETHEFTRALLARSEQAEREQQKKQAQIKKDTTESSAVQTDAALVLENDIPQNPTVKVEDENHALIDDVEDNMDIEELAKEVQEDKTVSNGLDGVARNSVATSRGLGHVMDILRQTGELTRKNAGKETMHGRAKDKRTYDDYEPLDLSQVVQIDSRTATDKDLEIAARQVQLEYRDKHGRLLTRKEAFRELSYQFHGKGSGKRKQEKRMRQIAHEQAAARLASQQVASADGAGLLGALKATQKASGKAYIVHKT